MNRGTLFRRAALTVVAVSMVVGAAAGWRTLTAPQTVRAVFEAATAVYVGDEVRVSGVEVGRIVAIEPLGTTVEMVLEIDGDVPVPADAGAVIVAQSLVDARYVQLTPAYRGHGPTLEDGAVIPRERTAVPVEWDEIKTQLTRLATELGPDSTIPSSSVGRFIDSAAHALDGNGEALRQSLTELSAVGRILAEDSSDVADTIRNLQQFVSALQDSNVQIVEFQNRLATVTSVLDGSRSDLDSALTNLSIAVGEVQRFVAENRDGATEQVHRLTAVTQNLVDNRDDLEELLHIFPSSMANFYNIYNPDTATEAGVFVLNNFSNPIQFVCSAIASIENTTSEESARKCRDYLGPVLPLLSFNYLPTPVNPLLGPSARPENLLYTEPHLIPPVDDSPPDLRAIAPAATLGPADILFPGGFR